MVAHVGYGSKPELQCTQCHGFGHHADMCSTPDDMVDSELQCEECDGYGHHGKECANWGGYNKGFQSKRPKHQARVSAATAGTTFGVMTLSEVDSLAAGLRARGKKSARWRVEGGGLAWKAGSGK